MSFCDKTAAECLCKGPYKGIALDELNKNAMYVPAPKCKFSNEKCSL